MDDKELFSAALADEPAPEQPQAEPEEQTSKPEEARTEERARDEMGRFAPKQDAEPEVTKPQPAEPSKDEAQVPSWRLREVRERGEAAERRAQENERNLYHAQQEMRAMSQRLREFEQPKTPTDIFENPSEFVQQGVKRAVDPVQQEIAQMREFYSRKDAIRAHGEKAVTDAYGALESAMKGGDRDGWALYQRAMQSMDPYGDIMSWHTQRTVISKIGSDPDKWWEQTLEERLKDPAYQGKLLERIRGTASPVSTDGRPNVNLPPSLNRISGTGASSLEAEDTDVSDRALFQYATAKQARR